MGKLCISMYLIIHCTPCIAFVLVAHGCIFAIDHEEKGRAEPPEPAPVDTTFNAWCKCWNLVKLETGRGH
jgi:hypothetical protein